MYIIYEHKLANLHRLPSIQEIVYNGVPVDLSQGQEKLETCIDFLHIMKNMDRYMNKQFVVVDRSTSRIVEVFDT